jgi:hypothetical protein
MAGIISIYDRAKSDTSAGGCACAGNLGDLRPVRSAALGGEHIPVMWKRLWRNPRSGRSGRRTTLISDSGGARRETLQ